MARDVKERFGKRFVREAGWTLGTTLVRVGIVVVGVRALNAYLKQRDAARAKEGLPPEIAPGLPENLLAGLAGLGHCGCNGARRGGIEEIIV